MIISTIKCKNEIKNGEKPTKTESPNYELLIKLTNGTFWKIKWS